MNRLALAGVALLGVLVILAPSRAEDKDVKKDDRKDDKEATVFRSVDLLGKRVTNAKGEALGQLEDCVVNMKDGHIVYAALAYGETLGFGGKLFAVSPKALRLSDDWKSYMLNVSKDDLDKAQGFDANKWPTSPDPRWSMAKDDGGKKDGERKDGERKDSEKKEDVHLRRLTSLSGLAVKNNDGETLGSAAGFGIDLEKHRVVYIAMAHGGVAGINAKYFAIPWEAAEFKSLTLNSGRVFVVNATKNDFENQPGFDYKKWPNRSDMRFLKDKPKSN
jgi:sporulation protein YlmC with PRC-barrel domain